MLSLLTRILQFCKGTLAQAMESELILTNDYYRENDYIKV
uniref:Uncharacterized protein n=1 Tax=Arundo donax TaxID=35708 RepID=A0A0A9HU52_ARUDO